MEGKMGARWNRWAGWSALVAALVVSGPGAAVDSRVRVMWRRFPAEIVIKPTLGLIGLRPHSLLRSEERVGAIRQDPDFERRSGKLPKGKRDTVSK